MDLEEDPLKKIIPNQEDFYLSFLFPLAEEMNGFSLAQSIPFLQLHVFQRDNI